MWWQLRKRFTTEPKDIPYYGWRLRCHTNSNSAANVIYFTERYDPTEMSLMAAYLRPGDGFIDVGANIGSYSLLATSLVSPRGHIDAFEPDPVAAARLRENLELNGITNVSVWEAAVSDESGQAEFVQGWDVSNRLQTAADRGQPTCIVNTTRLDEALESRSYSMGKLDVEGFELAALRGAVGRLESADPPVWIIELIDHQLSKAGATRKEVELLLAEHGFRVGYYDAQSRCLRYLPSTREGPTNICAIHHSAALMVTERLSAATAE